MRDALRMEFAQAKKGRQLRDVARALIDRALDCDVGAIQEIANRLDGRVPQSVEAADGNTEVIVQIIRFGLAAAAASAAGATIIEHARDEEDKPRSLPAAKA